MQTIIIVVVLFAMAMLALGIGAALGRRPLERSCGGSACLETCSRCTSLEREPTP